jgi:hypothetical protein
MCLLWKILSLYAGPAHEISCGGGRISLARGRSDLLVRVSEEAKVSPIDTLALDRFDDYSAARDAMLVATDSAAAPWTVVNSNDKRRALLDRRAN